MDPRRAQTERNMLPVVGPSFFREGETVMFQFVVDSSNVLGPRPAKRTDQENHPGAWAQFAAADGVSSLDRDAKDGPGGSLPVESPSAAPPVEAVTSEPVFQKYDGYTELNILPEEPPSITADDLGGGEFVTKDGASFQSLKDAADHVASAPKPKRKYTRRTGA
jgi:hypothetical protein